jgi:hypothetical protein
VAALSALRPQDPDWPNRDRFVLSVGHASMLLYSLLHLCGVKAKSPSYEQADRLAVTLDDLKNFRRAGNRCTGHPEYGWTSGTRSNNQTSRFSRNSTHQGCTVIENEQYEVELAQAARKIAQRARGMAEVEHVHLTGTKWHRGHEVADLDNWWLTLTSDTRGITEHFPNEWLETLGNIENDERVVQRLSRMVKALMPPPERHTTPTLAR